MPSGSYERIATSLLQREGENSASLMLFLLSLDFGSVFGREDEEFVEREQVFADNLDLDSGIPPCLGWDRFMLGCRASIPFALSSNFGGAVSLLQSSRSRVGFHRSLWPHEHSCTGRSVADCF